MSVEGRVQEIQSHKLTHVHQNHEKWFISQAHSSISDGDLTILSHTLINFNLCYIQRFKSHSMGGSVQEICLDKCLPMRTKTS